MTNFHHVDPSLPSLYRAVILFGLNTASYKFSLGKSLIELADADAEFVPIETLARHFSKHVAEHVADAPKQSTRKTSVGYFKTCRRFNLGEVNEGELVHETVKNAFDDVIDRFHIDERKEFPSGIRLTDDLYRLVKEARGAELMPEIEARWRLVETAWELNILRSLVTVQHDARLEELFVKSPTASERHIEQGGTERVPAGKMFFLLRPDQRDIGTA
jgi:hypothetical protein